MLWPVRVLALLLVVGGLWIAPLYTVAIATAGQLLDPSAYVAAVLGVRP
jgi:multicomponent Na+:H+ antiporter subunit D